MPILTITLEEPAWPDLANNPNVIKAMGETDSRISITGLERGMTSGAPSVALRIDLPDGRVVITETSLRLFLTAADCLKERYGDPRI